MVTATFDPEHWIYWLGPFIGALIAWAFYRFIKTLEYEVRLTGTEALTPPPLDSHRSIKLTLLSQMVNPGADGDPLNDPNKNPEKRAELHLARSKSSLPSVKAAADAQSVQ